MNLLILVSLAYNALAFNASVSEPITIPHYYGAQFAEKYSQGHLTNEELKTELFRILSAGHLKNQNQPDEITESCTQQEIRYRDTAFNDVYPYEPQVTNNKKCVQHVSLGYDGARKKLFGTIHLRQNNNGQYFVKDVYCEREFTDKDFGGSPTFGPGMLPKSGSLINTEHTWPQSRFTGRFSREMQKSDLHHLFPTDSEMNSRRGSLRFGYVVGKVEPLKCPQNKVGHHDQGNDIIFEVPDAQKGNTARAIFYFATRYQMKLSPPEEAALRRWNEIDPVDEDEKSRNDQVETFQGNRNPYVDLPEILSRIDKF